MELSVIGKLTDLDVVNCKCRPKEFLVEIEDDRSKNGYTVILRFPSVWDGGG